MKRYWLFEQPQYDASGGMLDFSSDYDTVEEAEDARVVKFDRNESLPIWQEYPVTERRRILDEIEKRDMGYHILDTWERKIVHGWCQYEKKPIKETPLNQFK